MTVGPHRLDRLLGRGGMGAVFLAYDTRLHRQVALKIIERELDGATRREQLLREARNAAALNHPHICTIHEVGESEAGAFIAMEYVPGRSLRDRIDRGALPIDETVRLGIQAADALAYAHDHGVVHRDFKAANVIVGEDGRLKVVDFGLARREEAALADASTLATAVPAGSMAGTPYSMAPEQVRGEPADPRTDVWALGVLLYEMVTGGRPFVGRTAADLLSSILTAPPRTMAGTVPIGIRTAIGRCLEKDPARRYQRASHLREVLEAIAAGTVAPWVTWGQHLRHRLMPVLVGALAMVATVLVGLNPGGVRDRLFGPTPQSPIRLAVLPFQNLTGDPDQEHLSDGLTDEMITELGRLHPERLSVIARTSSMRYKSAAVAIGDVGRALNVDYVLEGSSRREGDRLRVSARLIQVRSQSQVWTDSFDRELSGILTLQQDVARGVAASLALALLPDRRAALNRAAQVNPEAYEAYLKGQSHLQRLTRGDLDQALKYFELSLEKDPGFARGHFGISTVWAGRRVVGFVASGEGSAASKAALQKALALDPALPEAHLALANQYVWQDWNWAAADPEYRRALDVGPSDALARVFYARYLNVMGRPEEAALQFKRALELDPLSELVKAMYGASLLHHGRLDEAITNAQSILETTPESPQALAQLALALYFQGRHEESLSVEKQSLSSRSDRQALAAIDRGYSENGYRGAMRQLADVVAARPFGRARAAGFYVRAGENERALDVLEELFAARENGMVEIGVASIYRDLRRHPRFQAILRQMNLPG